MPSCPAVLLFLLLVTVPAAATELRVLDPSLEDCEELSQRLAQLPRGRQEPVRSLGEEGARLCQEGQVRLGVAKLRRALRTAQRRARPAP
ncbi:MAG TPA: hypothetical protein VNZ61_17030 [Roseomonas sp.]|nr:hypothetical protein [Roseomonas sp.]